jgi:hypothetical protein
MKPRTMLTPCLMAGLLLAAWHAFRAGGPPPAALAQPAPAMVAPVDSFAAQRDSMMRAVLREIAGREDAPAESVYKDIRIFKGMPAARVARIMNLGFGRSLGVSCLHCHVEGRWASEEKTQKQIARDMWEMMGAINREHLPKIKNLQSKEPGINCTTCHRGAVKPALNL